MQILLGTSLNKTTLEESYCDEYNCGCNLQGRPALVIPNIIVLVMIVKCAIKQS